MSRRRGVWGFVRRHRDGWPLLVLVLLGLGTWLSRMVDDPLLWMFLSVAAVATAVALTWWVRRRLIRLRDRVLVTLTDMSGVDRMNGREFEEHVALLMRTCGYRRVEVVGGASDGGVDVRARAPDGRAVVVQCKRWRRPVPPNEVRAFLGTLAGSHRGYVGLFVASNGFTDAAVEEAGEVMTLVDRDELALWMRGRWAPSLPTSHLGPADAA